MSEELKITTNNELKLMIDKLQLTAIFTVAICALAFFITWGILGNQASEKDLEAVKTSVAHVQTEAATKYGELSGKIENVESQTRWGDDDRRLQRALLDHLKLDYGREDNGGIVFFPRKKRYWEQ